MSDFEAFGTFGEKIVGDQIKLPQMQEMLGTWWPMPQSNLHWDGKRRDDLPDDAQIHCYHGWWTLDELKKYGALPAKPWNEGPLYEANQLR